MFYLVTAIVGVESSTRFVHTFDDIDYAKLCMSANVRSCDSADFSTALIRLDRTLSARERVGLRDAVPLDAELIDTSEPERVCVIIQHKHLASVLRDAMDLPVRVGARQELATV